MYDHPYAPSIESKYFGQYGDVSKIDDFNLIKLVWSLRWSFVSIPPKWTSFSAACVA